MDTKQVLLDAAGLIETHGFDQGRYVNDKGRYCTVGAIRMAANGRVGGLLDGDELPVLTYLASRIDPESINPWCVLVEWNDNEDRTAEDVVAALRQAAASVTA